MGKRSFVVLLLVGLSSTCFGAAPQKESIAWQGKTRTYYTFAPEKLAGPAPLMLLLHGSGRDGMSQIDVWKLLAEKQGIVLVAPDSDNSRNWKFDIDGPGFLHEVVEAVRKKYSIDGKRLYLFGHSAGATFSLYTATAEPLYFAAAAVHAGAVKEEYHPVPKNPARKLAATIWVGDKDPIYNLPLVNSAVDTLKANGFDANVVVIPNHDHDFYGIAGRLCPEIWNFLRSKKLADGPKWQEVPAEAAKPVK